MILLFLLCIIVLLAIFIFIAIGWNISKAVNGVFFSMFGNLFVVVKIFCIAKKLLFIAIFIKLFQMEKANKANKKG